MTEIEKTLLKIQSWEENLQKNFGLVIVDGVIDPEKYLQSKFRIAWFLKEAYTREAVSFHIKEHCAQENAYNNFFSHIATPTWHPIIYSSYGILNDFLLWDEMDFIRKRPEMCDIIKSIAIVNANKSPSKTDTFTTLSNLSEGFSIFKNTIKDQLNVLKPEIHIFCGTAHLYKESFGLNNQNKIVNSLFNEFKNCEGWIKNEKLFLSVYHPANRSQKREEYVDQIIRAAKYWYLKK